jgi:ribosomal protein S18 acetylase RimI-like enzyme
MSSVFWAPAWSRGQQPPETEHVVGLDQQDRERDWMTDTRSEVSLDGVTYRWRDPVTDAEMVELINSHCGTPAAGWWDQIRQHSYGWVSARLSDGALVGFVNVVTDGGDHAFLIDTKTHGAFQHRGIGTRVVSLAATHAKAAKCEWLHVDWDPGLAAFYVDACGFTPTEAGLIHLPSL